MYPLSPKICDIKSFAMGGGGETFYSRSQLEFRRTFSKQVENQDDCRAFRSGLPSPFPLQARIKIKSSAILPEDPSSLRSFFTLHGFPRSHLYLRGGAVTTSSGAETGDFSRSGARSSISPGPQLYFLSTRSASEGGPGTFSAASGCGWSSKLPGRQRGRRSGARPLFGAACPAVRRCRGFRPGSHPAVAPCLPKGGSRGGPACMGCLDGIRGPLSPPRNVSGPHPTGQGTTIPQTGSRHPPLALEAAG